MATSNCQYSTRYCWDAEKVKALIRLRAELSPLFTGKRNASKYAWAVVERELNVPLPLSKIIKKWNNLLQEYKAIKVSEEPKRREWPFFTLMDVYFSDQVNNPSLRLFSSTKTLKESLDESVFEDDPIIVSAIAAATSGAYMEIDELLKRQKDRRSNENNISSEHRFTPENMCTSENKFASERLSSSKMTSYRISGNKTNVVTVKKLNFMQQHPDDKKNLKSLLDLGTNENMNSPKPVLSQEQSPPTATAENKYSDPNSIDQYLLSWNNFLGNMSRGFHTLQKDEKMVDVTIAAGGKTFKAHKLVLSVCSPYFQEIFLENPSNHPILLLADVEANHMAGLLNFMYSGQVNVKYEDLPVFLKVAEAMKIKGLHTEKPEGEDLEEIQFSRENTSTNWQALNSSSMPINFTGPSSAESLTKEKQQQYHTAFNPIHRNENFDSVHSNENTLNLKKSPNKFSILKSNGSKKLSEHLKQQKYLTKRKTFIDCENKFKEKRNNETSEKGPYNSDSLPSYVNLTERTPHEEKSNSEEVLNLARNEVPIVPMKSFSESQVEIKNACAYNNQPIFNEIQKDNRKDLYIDDEHTFHPEWNEDRNNNILSRQISFHLNENNIDANCNSYNNSIVKKPYQKNQNDETNKDSIDSSNDTKINFERQADNNNNVFISSGITDKEKQSGQAEITSIKPFSKP